LSGQVRRIVLSVAEIPATEGLKMLELETLDKAIELFDSGKINGTELAELILKAGAK